MVWSCISHCCHKSLVLALQILFKRDVKMHKIVGLKRHQYFTGGLSVSFVKPITFALMSSHNCGIYVQDWLVIYLFNKTHIVVFVFIFQRTKLDIFVKKIIIFNLIFPKGHQKTAKHQTKRLCSLSPRFCVTFSTLFSYRPKASKALSTVKCLCNHYNLRMHKIVNRYLKSTYIPVPALFAP